jgi:glycosyltransferase involved in cell wall biosynthesis
MRVIIYPNIPVKKGEYANPYIQDFIFSLKRKGIQIINTPNKNPLVSLFFKENRYAHIYIFHWIENVPVYKYGYIQFVLTHILVLLIKIKRKKIVYFMHNKQPHIEKKSHLCLSLMRFMICFSDLIITHALDGLTLIKEKYPKYIHKAHFLDHPTKDRLDSYYRMSKPCYDLLIWGTISKYKGILEFIQFAKDNNYPWKIKIIGSCSSPAYFDELLKLKSDNVCVDNKNISFKDINRYISDSKFILIPYMSESVLSSGTLMDSLSFGAKIIGPNVGSFKDYSKNINLNVYTFSTYSEIQDIIDSHKEDINIAKYHSFLQENSWENFTTKLLILIY